MTFNGSNVAFRSRVRSIATLTEHRKSYSGKIPGEQKNRLNSGC